MVGLYQSHHLKFSCSTLLDADLNFVRSSDVAIVAVPRPAGDSMAADPWSSEDSIAADSRYAGGSIRG